MRTAPARHSAAPPYGLVPLTAQPWDHRGEKTIDFELAAALAVGGSAEAFIRLWGTEETDSDTGIALPQTPGLATSDLVVRVHDVMHEFAGEAGAFGWAEWRHGRWVILNLQCA